MTSHIPKLQVLSGRERRRRWTSGEKLAIVQETYEPDVTVSIVARRHGIQPNQLEAVPAFEYRALQNQVKELQRLLVKKTMEGESSKKRLSVDC